MCAFAIIYVCMYICVYMNEKGYEIIILKVRVLPIKLYNIIAMYNNTISYSYVYVICYSYMHIRSHLNR